VGPKCAKSSNGSYVAAVKETSTNEVVESTSPARFVGCHHCGGQDHYTTKTETERCVACNYIWKVDEFVQDQDDPHLYHANQSHDACDYCGHDDHYTDENDVDRCEKCHEKWVPEPYFYEVRR
jgi:predicted Zn-ribbon and HTH transcriptional regulator